jgi:hypothetical protein
MSKLILNSIVIAILLGPTLAAADPRPLRGLRRAVLGTLVADALYLVALLVIYPRLT